LEKIEGEFDLIFLDADKTNYQGYMNLILERRLLSPKGIVLVDNGKQPAKLAPNTTLFQKSNSDLSFCPRVDNGK